VEVTQGTLLLLETPSKGIYVYIYDENNDYVRL
jgi:hypothetical protein